MALFLAKTKDQETIQQHTNKLLSKYRKLKNVYPNIPNINWELLRMACAYHDLGKMNVKFQNKIREKLNQDGGEYEILKDEFESIEEIPHGHLSVAFLEEDKLKKIFSDDEILVLYQAIYYHHNRPATNVFQRKAIIEKELSESLKNFDYKEVQVSKLNVRYGKKVETRIGRDNYPHNLKLVNDYILIKGLLNKIDYGASGNFDVEIESDGLYDKTLDFFNKGGFSPNSLQTYMMNHKEEHNIIIASTGIGKTEAALLWIGNEKGFFTLPLKVSINAIYDRLIEKIGHDKSKTGLLHSDTKLEYMKREEYVLDMERVNNTKQLSMPLTICTLDQLIDFVFKCEGYEVKLATLSYSKLVIDEIQMYSPEMIAYLILALRDIHEIGGKFSILTATLPPIFIDFLSNQIKNYKFKPQVFLKLNKDNKPILRHFIKTKETYINIMDITKYYGEKRILVIVNTVKKAQDIYDQLIKLGYNKVELLHSRFIRIDRGNKEEKILKDGKIGELPCLWITTQIVEASLDIDFDILYTELSDLTGLFQRMGRVFRGRDFSGNQPNVIAYVGESLFDISGIGYVVDKDIFKLSKKALIDLGECKITEEIKMDLVADIYSKEKLKDTDYYKKIKNTIRAFEKLPEYELEKKEVKLRDIKTKTVIPKIIYDSEYDTINKFMDGLKDSNGIEKIKIKEDIMGYTVSIPEQEYEYAKKNGFVCDELMVDEYTFLPVLNYAYNIDKGLYRHVENLDDFCEENQFC